MSMNLNVSDKLELGLSIFQLNQASFFFFPHWTFFVVFLCFRQLENLFLNIIVGQWSSFYSMELNIPRCRFIPGWCFSHSSLHSANFLLPMHLMEVKECFYWPQQWNCFNHFYMFTRICNFFLLDNHRSKLFSFYFMESSDFSDGYVMKWLWNRSIFLTNHRFYVSCLKFCAIDLFLLANDGFLA